MDYDPSVYPFLAEEKWEDASGNRFIVVRATQAIDAYVDNNRATLVVGKAYLPAGNSPNRLFSWDETYYRNRGANRIGTVVAPNLRPSPTTAPYDNAATLQSFLNSLSVGEVVDMPNCTAGEQFYSSAFTVPAGITLNGSAVRGASPTAQGGAYLRAMPGGSFPNGTFITLGGNRAQLSRMTINGDAVVDNVVDASNANDSWHDSNTIMNGNKFCWIGDNQRNHYLNFEFSGNVKVSTDAVITGGRQGAGFFQVDGSCIMQGVHMNSNNGGSGNLVLNSGGIIINGCVIDTWGTDALGAIQITANATINPITISACGFIRTSNSTAPFINIVGTSARGIITGCTEWQTGAVTPGSVPTAIAFGSAANASRWGVIGNMFPNSTALYDFAPGVVQGNYNNGVWTA